RRRSSSTAASSSRAPAGWTPSTSRPPPNLPPPEPPRVSVSPEHLVREIVPFVLLVCACGAAVSTPLPSPPTPASAQPSAAPAPPSSPPESYEDLAALGATLAPGMGEIARRSSSGDAVEMLRAAAGDACVRVAFAAEAPVVAKLVDGKGEALAMTGPALQGALG